MRRIVFACLFSETFVLLRSDLFTRSFHSKNLLSSLSTTAVQLVKVLLAKVGLWVIISRDRP